MIRVRSDEEYFHQALPQRRLTWRHLPCFLGALILCAVISGASWAYGGIDYGTQPIVFAIASIGCILGICGYWCLTPHQISERSRWIIALIPLFLGVAWGAFHLIPTQKTLPTFNGKSILITQGIDTDPRELRREFFEGQLPISLYPAATRESLAWICLAIATFMTGMIIALNRTWIPWILGAIAVNGAILAFWGFSEEMAAANQIARQSIPSWGKPFATFVNRNNAAGFLNLSLAASIGFLLWQIPLTKRADSYADPFSVKMKRKSLFLDLRDSFSQLHAGHFTSLLLIVVCASGVIASASRGGILAMVVGGCLSGAILLRQHAMTLKLLAVGAFLTVITIPFLLWSGLDQHAVARLSTLTSPGITDNGRLPHWRDALTGISEHWLTGTGLGTYRYAYLPYQSGSQAWFIHAENQYLETTLELGIPGLLVLLAAIAIVTWTAFCLLSGGDSIQFALGAAGMFAMISQSTHAVFDFGLYLPANMLAFALICGMVYGAKPESGPRPQRLFAIWPRLNFKSTRLLGFTGSMAVLTIGVFVGYSEVRAHSMSADLARRLPNLNEPKALDQRELGQYVFRTEYLLSERPDDALAQQMLANLKIYKFRQRALEDALDELSPLSATQKTFLWEQSRLDTLSQALNHWYALGRNDLMEVVTTNQLVRENLGEAVEHLRASKKGCPILPGVDLSLAKLAFAEDPNDPRGLRYIHQAAILAPKNPESLFQAGVLADRAGEVALANDMWRRVLAQDSSRVADVLTFARIKRSLREIVDNVFPESPDLIFSLLTDSQFQWTTGERDLIFHECRKLHEKWGNLDHPDDFYRDANLKQWGGDTPGAISSFRKAILLAPDKLEWRLELVDLLIQSNDLLAAQEELRKSIRMTPNRKDIQIKLKNVTAQLVRQPDFRLKIGP